MIHEGYVPTQKEKVMIDDSKDGAQRVKESEERLKQEIIKMKEDPVLVIFKRLNWLTDEIKSLKSYIYDGRTGLVDTRIANLMMDKRERKTEHEFYERWNKLAKKNDELIEQNNKLKEQNDKLIEQLDTVPNQIESVSSVIQSNTANINAQWEKIHNLQKQIDFIAEHVGIKKKRNE